VGLAAGVWSEQVRPLVQHYLYDLKLKRIEAAAHQLDEMQEATRLAVEEAIKAKARASTLAERLRPRRNKKPRR
jgi:hypothetical protein